MTRHRIALATTLLALTGLTGCGSGEFVEADDAPDPGISASPAPASSPELPKGWRWESYRGAQVGVPGEWTWINGSQREGQWCVGGDIAGEDRPVGIGRPGIATTMGCSSGKGVSPSALIERNGVFAAFSGAEFNQAGLVGDRLTIHLGGVALLIQAEPALRDRIAATAHTVEVDANGCPARDGIAADPSRAPQPAVALRKLTDVRSVAACLYSLRDDGIDTDGASLISSLRIVEAAPRVMTALADAPPAGGQDRANCRGNYGREVLVLLIDSDTGRSRVHVRFSGCDLNGVDDGVSPRKLTPALVPLFSGGNFPGGFSSGAGKKEALWGYGNGKIPERTAPPA